MTSATTPSIKNQESLSFGLVESASVNSFADFVPTKLTEGEAYSDREIYDFLNSFICHLIFYAVFCISLVLHILIDLGLGALIQSKFDQLIMLAKGIELKKKPAFA